VEPVSPREAALDPGVREREPGAAAARAMAALKNLVASGGKRSTVVARLDSRYVDHVLLDGPASALQSKHVGSSFCTRNGRQLPRKGY